MQSNTIRQFPVDNEVAQGWDWVEDIFEWLGLIFRTALVFDLT
jgi:hypothetical protein